LPVPCNARCMNQRNKQCQLNDERISASQVEFGEEWNPAEQCVGYLPQIEKESAKRRKR
jgi:hypothetical protein